MKYVLYVIYTYIYIAIYSDRVTYCHMLIISIYIYCVVIRIYIEM